MRSILLAIVVSLILALALGCIPEEFPTADQSPADTPTALVARQLDVRIDPQDAATILLNPAPVGKGGYLRGVIVTIDILPQEGWEIDEWVGPVFSVIGNNAKIEMVSSRNVVVKLKRADTGRVAKQRPTIRPPEGEPISPSSTVPAKALKPTGTRRTSAPSTTISDRKLQLVFIGTNKYAAAGKQWMRYELSVSNWERFPVALFEPSPDLPPCGFNTNSSRTWLDILDAKTGNRLYGYCGISSPKELGSIGFAVEEGVPPPDTVYVTLLDRRSNVTYRSNRVAITVGKSPATTPSTGPRISENLAPNPSFERGVRAPSGWSSEVRGTDAILEWDERITRWGNRSLKVTAGRSVNQGLPGWETAEAIPIEPGEVYEFSVWAYIEDKAIFWMDIDILDPAGRSLIRTSSGSILLDQTGEWLQMTKALDTNHFKGSYPDMAAVKLGLRLSLLYEHFGIPKGTVTSIYYDDVTFSVP